METAMLEQPCRAAQEIATSGRAAPAAPQRGEPGAAGIVVDTTLIAELALTFDLDRLVAEAINDPFRRR
jgi:hypothetical protein